jgi:ABC-2 type transport system permease protein
MNARAKFLWSVRREVWEDRVVYIAPLSVAGLVLFAFLFHMRRFAEGMRALPSLDSAKQLVAVVTPFSLAASVILLVTFIVAMFYCLDALYTERRDRSILFWKSMPVSDRTTVLAKASIPLVVLPLVAWILSVVTFGILMLLGTLVLLGSGVSPARLWSEMRVLQEGLIMLYGLAVHALWFAPIYGWLLLVSAWARRTPVLWAVLPFFAISVAERLAFGVTNDEIPSTPSSVKITPITDLG